MPRHCLTLDLKDDQAAIAEYKRYHVKIWPEVKQSLFDAGVEEMEIYLLGTRMFMIMDVNDSFSLSAKAAMDLARPAATSGILTPSASWAWRAAARAPTNRSRGRRLEKASPSLSNSG